MNLLQLKRRVRNIVGDEAGVFIEDEELLDYLNDGYYDMARRTKLLRDVSAINTVAGTAEYPLPAGFILEKRVTFNSTRIKKTTVEMIDQIDREKDLASNTGTPFNYYIWGLKLGLYPTPDQTEVGKLKLYYTRLPLVVLAVDADIPELPTDMHEDIVRYAVARCREQAEDYEVATSTMGEYTQRAAVSTEQAQNQTDTSYPAVRDIDSEMSPWHGGWTY